MEATVLMNPWKKKRSRAKARRSKKRRVGSVGLGRTKRRRRSRVSFDLGGKKRSRRRRTGMAAWFGAKRKHSRASKKGWRHKRGITVSNPRRTHRRRRVGTVALSNPRRRRSYRMGSPGAFRPASGTLNNALWATGGFVVASKGGDYLSKCLRGFGLGPEIGRPLFGYLATAFGTMILEKGTDLGRQRNVVDSFQIGGLAYVTLLVASSFLRNVLGVRSRPLLGDYEQLSGDEDEDEGMSGIGEYDELGDADDEVNLLEGINSGVGLGSYEAMPGAMEQV